jgi:predicted RNA-binding protein with PIN domain
MDMMCNYQGYKKCLLILVFDAYKVKGNIGMDYPYHNIHVVYTKEAQTADMYIERATHQLAKEYNVVVATSDALEQLITYGAGATRMSSRELKIDLDYINKEGQKEYSRKQKVVKNTLLEDVKYYRKEEE